MGPTGPIGPKGDTGAAGPVGPQGPQGVKGDKGDQGPKGDSGAQGVAGPTGATGATGLMGPKGDTGDIGQVGPMGPKGDKGDIGAQGATGEAGPQGPQGLKGDKGDTGSGPQGTAGPQGPQGGTGPQGPAGPNTLTTATTVSVGASGQVLVNNGGIVGAMSLGTAAAANTGDFATAAQGALAASALQPQAGITLYPATDNSHAEIEITKTGTPSADRQGAIHSIVNRNGGTSGAAAHWLEYRSTGGLTGGFDIDLTTLARADTINGGVLGSQWWVAATPNTNTGPWQVYGGEINPFNAYADNGYQEDPRTNSHSTHGLFMVAESELNVGRGLERGYNASSGITFLRSIGASDTGSGRIYPSAKWWIPIDIDTDATAPGGTSVLLRGGSSAGNAPGKGIKFLDNHADGIDLSGATFSGSAIKLSPSQTITDGTTTKTLSQLAIPITLQTNGSNNGSQSALNLAAGSNVALSESGGTVTISSTGVSGGGGGTVTSVTSANSDIVVANGTTSPLLTLNSGTGANQILKLGSDASMALSGPDWIAGIGTVTAVGSATLTANTSGAFSALKAGASIKLSTGVVVETMSLVDSSNVILTSNNNITSLTWSYKNPTATLQSNGTDVLYLKASGGLQLKGDGTANPTITMHTWNGANGIRAYRADGTVSTPSALAANDVLLNMTAGGYNGSTWVNAAQIATKAGENWTSTATGTYQTFSNISNGTTTLTERMRIAQGVSIGSTTDCGSGNLCVSGTVTASNLLFGTYTPTLTNISGVTASSAYTNGTHYQRVGNEVKVDGKINATTSANGANEVDISLPVASNVSGTYDCSGTVIGGSGSSAQILGSVSCDSTNHRAKILFYNTIGIGAFDVNFGFMYTVD
jgi:hypothetical protein